MKIYALMVALLGAGAHGFQLNATVEISSTKYTAGQNLPVVFTLTNTGEDVERIVSWNTPLDEDCYNNIFTVDGKPSFFLGMIQEHSERPRPEDIITLAPGKSITKKFDLAEWVRFHKNGKHRVWLNMHIDRLPRGVTGPVRKSLLKQYRLLSNAIDIRVTGTKRQGKLKLHPFCSGASDEAWEAGAQREKAAAAQAPCGDRAGAEQYCFSLRQIRRSCRQDEAQVCPRTCNICPVPTKVVDGITFRGCSDDRIRTLQTSVKNALAMTKKSLAMSRGTDESTESEKKHWQTWWGTFKKPFAKGNPEIVARIVEHLEKRKFKLDCDHGRYRSAFAYVTPTDPSFKINLGQAFWRPEVSNDMWQVNSKPGTLIHELSHFKPIGDTLDIMYGIRDTRALAKQSAEKASNNADNYEFYSECKKGNPDCTPSTGSGAAALPSWGAGASTGGAASTGSNPWLEGLFGGMGSSSSQSGTGSNPWLDSLLGGMGSSTSQSGSASGSNSWLDSLWGSSFSYNEKAASDISGGDLDSDPLSLGQEQVLQTQYESDVRSERTKSIVLGTVIGVLGVAFVVVVVYFVLRQEKNKKLIRRFLFGPSSKRLLDDEGEETDAIEIDANEIDDVPTDKKNDKGDAQTGPLLDLPEEQNDQDASIYDSV